MNSLIAAVAVVAAMTVQVPVGGKAKTTFADRAKQCFWLPDGTLCDASQFYELRDAINYIHNPKQTPAYRGRPSRGWTRVAWETRNGYFNEESAFAAKHRDHELFALENAVNARPFIFIDEDGIDAVMKTLDRRHYARIVQEFPDNVVKVDVRSLDAVRCEIYVQIPDRSVIKDNALTGKFVLWPDEKIVHPVTGSMPYHAEGSAYPRHESSSDSWVYRYVSVASPPVTADDVRSYLKDGRIQMWVWTWRPEGDRVIWTKERLTADAEDEKPKDKK